MPVAVVAVPAIFAVIVLLAAYILIEVIGRTIGSSLPIPGLDVIGRWIGARVNDIVNAMAGFLSNVAHGIENLINVPVNALRGIFQSIANALARFASTIDWIVRFEIPNIFTQMAALYFQAINFARDLVVEFFNYALQVVANVENFLISRMDAIANYLENVIASVYSTLAAAISAALQSAINFAVGIYNTLVGLISQVQNFLISEINSAVAAVEHYAQELANWAVNTAFAAATAWAAEYVNAAINIARRDLDAIIAGEMGAIWDYLLQEVHDAIAAVTEGVDWMAGRLDWLESLPLTDIASVIFALAGAISIPLEWVARCGTKLCSSLGGFGNEMDNLADDAIIALIIAFAIAAAADPGGVAAGTRDFAAPSLKSISDGFANMIR